MNLGRLLLVTKLSNVTPTNSHITRTLFTPLAASIQIRNYAARKGTRERKKKAKVKVEVQKVGFIPHNLRNRDKLMAQRPSRKFDDSWKSEPIDDVYPLKYYKWRRYTFEEAVIAHQQTHHPEMYNKPDAPLYLTIELNMQGEKKTKFVDNFKRFVSLPHPYDHGEVRTVLVFAKTEESQQEAVKAGAHLAGGVDLIKQIQNGQVLLQDFQHIVAHPDILSELVVLRGVMKKKFPNIKLGTLDPDLGPVVDRFVNGVCFQAIKDEYEKDFGEIEMSLGPLSLGPEKLQENFTAVIKDVDSVKPRRAGGFIQRCLLCSPPSREKFIVLFEPFITDKPSEKVTEEEDEQEGEQVAL